MSLKKKLSLFLLFLLLCLIPLLVGAGGDVVANGGFGVDTDWTYDGGIWSIADGEATYKVPVPPNTRTVVEASIMQSALVVGKKYRVTYEITAIDANANMRLMTSDLLGNDTYGTTRTAIGVFTESIHASGSWLLLKGKQTAAGPPQQHVKIDNVSAIELPRGNFTLGFGLEM